MKTINGLTLYDLDPFSAELWAVVGPPGFKIKDINPGCLPDGFRWIDDVEWSEIQEKTVNQKHNGAQTNARLHRHA